MQRRRACVSTSASFQRSTPSTIRNRRPIANVIALSAQRDGLGRRRVALEDLDAAAPDSRSASARRRARRSPIRPWSSPWIEVGGLEGRPRAPSLAWAARHSRRVAPQRPAAGSSATVPSRSVRRPARRRRAAPRASRAPGGRSVLSAPDLDHRDPRAQPCSSAGSPASALPWWATLSTSTGRSVSAREHVGLGVGGQQHADRRRRGPAHDRALVGVLAGRRRAGRARRRPEDPQRAARRRAAARPASGATTRTPRAARGARHRAPRRLADAVAAVEHEPDRQRGEHRRRAAVVVGLGVGRRRARRAAARRPRAAARGSARPAARCRRAARGRRPGAASRRPARCRGTRRAAPARRRGGPRAAARAARPAAATAATAQPRAARPAQRAAARRRRRAPAHDEPASTRAAARRHRARRARGGARRSASEPARTASGGAPRRPRAAAPAPARAWPSDRGEHPEPHDRRDSRRREDVGRQRDERDAGRSAAAMSGAVPSVAATRDRHRLGERRAARRGARSAARSRRREQRRSPSDGGEAELPAGVARRRAGRARASRPRRAAARTSARPGAPASVATIAAAPMTPARWIDGPPPASGT